MRGVFETDKGPAGRTRLDLFTFYPPAAVKFTSRKFLFTKQMRATSRRSKSLSFVDFRYTDFGAERKKFCYVGKFAPKLELLEKHFKGYK